MLFRSHHVMGECNGVRGMWGYVRGGMGGISNALASAARARGVDIRVNSPVARILTRAGRVTGVALDDGTELTAPRVASNADAHVTFLKLVEERDLPPDFVSAVRAIDYSSASLKINVALSELPDFTAVKGSGLPPRSEEHTSELQSQSNLVCRLLLEKTTRSPARKCGC